MNKPFVLLALAALISSCQPKQEKEIDAKFDKPDVEETLTGIVWLDTRHLSPKNTEDGLDAKAMTEGGPSAPLSMTYAQANMPLSLFYAGLTDSKSAAKSVSPMPFLAFLTEKNAALVVRNIKSVNGTNVGSGLVSEQRCPDEIVALYQEAGKKLSDDSEIETRFVCLPLINSVVPNFLVSTDNSGAYVHEFLISAKGEGKSAGVLQAKIGVNILIPESPVVVAATSDLANLPLSQRLLMVSNDLKGSPRRDFRAFEISSLIAPGVNTAWVLTFTDPVMTIEEEVFFESPVIPRPDPAKPSISRGNSFYKRKAKIDSLDHFRIGVIDPNKPEELLSLRSKGTSIIEIPVTEATSPLRIFITPDFASPQATKSMFEYVKAFGPTFCDKELLAFKPEEWRQSLSNVHFIACEATLRRRLTDLAQAYAANVTYPIETYFGSFSYLPRLSAQSLGGTHGVLSLRISFSANLRVDVRNPHNQTTVTNVANIPISYNFQLPTVLSDMEKILISSTPPPGLDSIRTSIIRKGVFEFPVVKAGKVVTFPFMGEARTDLLH